MRDYRRFGTSGVIEIAHGDLLLLEDLFSNWTLPQRLKPENSLTALPQA